MCQTSVGCEIKNREINVQAVNLPVQCSGWSPELAVCEIESKTEGQSQARYLTFIPDNESGVFDPREKFSELQAVSDIVHVAIGEPPA